MWCDCSCGRLLTLTTQSDKSVLGLRTTTHTHGTQQAGTSPKRLQHGKHMPGKMKNQVRFRVSRWWWCLCASVCDDWPNAVVIVRKFEHIWQSAKVNRTRGWMGGRGSVDYTDPVSRRRVRNEQSQQQRTTACWAIKQLEAKWDFAFEILLQWRHGKAIASSGTIAQRGAVRRAGWAQVCLHKKDFRRAL